MVIWRQDCITLQASQNIEVDNPTPGKTRSGRRRWLRRGLWVLLSIILLLGVGLLWLNGPGVRWLAPKIATHYFQKAGMRGGFRLEGSLTGKLSIHDFWLETDNALERLTIQRAVPEYRYREISKGHLRGILAEGIHVELDLAKNPKTPEKLPLDLEKVVADLRKQRAKFIPLDLELRDVTLAARVGEKSLGKLGKSRVLHRAGKETLNLDIGAITDATGRVWPSRKIVALWNENDITTDQIEVLPGASVNDLVLGLPASGGPTVDAEIHIDDAVFVLGATPGLASLQLDLREGRVAAARFAEWMKPDQQVAIGGFLTSLSMDLAGILPNPLEATGGLRVLLEDLAWGDWRVPELNVDVGLDAAQASLAATGHSLNTAFAMNAAAPVVRGKSTIHADGVSGDFNIAEVSNVLSALADRVPAIDPEYRLPPTMMDGTFKVSLTHMAPSAVDLSAVLKPLDAEVASSLFLSAGWSGDQTIRLGGETEGLKASGSFHTESTLYQGDLAAQGFVSSRVSPWLAVFRVRSADVLTLDGTWSGSGVVRDFKHEGAVSLARAELKRVGDMPPVEAAGELVYDWPAGFSIKGLRLKTGAQTLAAEVRMADGLLDLSELVWNDGNETLATGTASLPVPADFSKWRETLANDERALSVDIRSSVLPLERLKPWLPAAGKIDPRSTGLLSVKVAGTYALPEIDAVLEVKGLRSPQQPRLPAADLVIHLAGRDGRLSLDGKATSPDLQPAVITASMPFRPGEWAADPGLIRQEKISARLDLPRIELSRFASLVPAARRLAGDLTGNVVVAGEVGSPDILGKIVMTNGVVELTNENVPPITGIQGALDLTTKRITLAGMSAVIAGGGLKASGTLELNGGKPGAIDLRFTGSHVPLVRNESMIIRANGALSVVGTYEQATVSGTIGVVNSLFYRDIELLPIGKPFTAPSAAKLPKLDKLTPKPAAAVPEPFRNWKLDLRVRTDHPFLIRGNFATGSIHGDVRLGGTIGDPLPNGDVRVSNLTAALPFSTMTVRSGVFHFTPATGFDPIMEVRGTARPHPYTVNIFAYGPASDPQLLLTSNPPLPDNEIMTLLATGTTTSGLEDPQAASTRALQLLAEEIRRGRFVFGKQLRPVLALFDRVELSLAETDPYSTESFSTATIRLDDRWLLSAGMGAEGDTRVMVIWRLRFH